MSASIRGGALDDDGDFAPPGAVRKATPEEDAARVLEAKAEEDRLRAIEASHQAVGEEAAGPDASAAAAGEKGAYFDSGTSPSADPPAASREGAGGVARKSAEAAPPSSSMAGLPGVAAAAYALTAEQEAAQAAEAERKIRESRDDAQAATRDASTSGGGAGASSTEASTAALGDAPAILAKEPPSAALSASAGASISRPLDESPSAGGPSAEDAVRAAAEDEDRRRQQTQRLAGLGAVFAGLGALFRGNSAPRNAADLQRVAAERAAAAFGGAMVAQDIAESRAFLRNASAAWDTARDAAARANAAIEAHPDWPGLRGEALAYARARELVPPGAGDESAIRVALGSAAKDTPGTEHLRARADAIARDPAVFGAATAAAVAADDFTRSARMGVELMGRGLSAMPEGPAKGEQARAFAAISEEMGGKSPVPSLLLGGPGGGAGKPRMEELGETMRKSLEEMQARMAEALKGIMESLRAMFRRG